MPGTYEPIATTTTSSSSGAITFSSISQSYTDLILVMSVKTTTTPTSFGTGVRFNSDTGTNYSRTYAYGYGTGTGTGRETNATRVFYSSSNTGQFNVIQLNIMNYSNSSVYKSVIARNDDIADVTSMQASLWRNTNAITSITITPYDDNSTGFATGCTFTLYGIAAA